MNRRRTVVSRMIAATGVVAVLVACADPNGSEYSRMVGEVSGSGTIQGTSVSFDTYADSEGPGAVYYTENEAYGNMRIHITQPIDNEGGYAGIVFRYEGIAPAVYGDPDSGTSGLLETQITSSIYEQLYGYQEEVVDAPISSITIDQNDGTTLRGSYDFNNAAGDSIAGSFTFWVERFDDGWPRY